MSRCRGFCSSWQLGVVLALAVGAENARAQDKGELTVTCYAERTTVVRGGVVHLRAWVTGPGISPQSMPAVRWSAKEGTLEQGVDVQWTLSQSIGKHVALATIAAGSPRPRCEVSVEVVASMPEPPEAALLPEGERPFDKDLFSLLPKGLTSTRELLPKGHPRPKDYGMYTYILFAKKPVTETDRERCLAILSDYFFQLNGLKVDGEKLDLSNRNITLVPVLQELDVPLHGLTQEQARKLAAFVLSQYDYDRARDLLNDSFKLAGDGPYVVSHSMTSKQFLVQNLGGLHPVDAGKWISTFGYLIVQEKTWLKRVFTTLLVELRSYLRFGGAEVDQLAARVWISEQA